MQERSDNMSKKIVAIGGGENGRVRISGKENPNLLFLAHSQIPFGDETEKNYYEVMKKNFENPGCEVR